MGLQKVRDVTLVRHAYVRPAHQGRGIGGALIRALIYEASTPLLVGTWAAAEWAIPFANDMAFAWSHRVRRIDFSRHIGTCLYVSKKPQWYSCIPA